MEYQVDVAVVILTHDQKDITLRCLSSFEDINREDIGILVWENGSTDGTREAIEKQFPSVEVRGSAQNLGAASGRNAGVEAATDLWDPEFFLFLDNDTIVISGIIEDLVVPFRRHSTIGVTTPKIRYMNSPRVINSAGGCHVSFWLAQTPAVGKGEVDRGQYDILQDCVPGSCCMLVKAEVFRDVQGFDTTYDPCYFEDTDFSLRVRDAGYRCIYVPDTVVYHDESQTFKRERYTQRYAYQKAKSWCYFVQQHATPVEKVGFWLVGVPLRLFGATVREVRAGNIKTIAGLLAGGWNMLVRRSED